MLSVLTQFSISAGASLYFNALSDILRFRLMYEVNYVEAVLGKHDDFHVFAMLHNGTAYCG